MQDTGQIHGTVIPGLAVLGCAGCRTKPLGRAGAAGGSEQTSESSRLSSAVPEEAAAVLNVKVRQD